MRTRETTIVDLGISFGGAFSSGSRALSERFGKYILHRRIATGGMAEVFEATLPGDAGFERRVAIKRILPSLSSDPVFVEMFIDEAKIAVHLSHANIAQILDLGKVGTQYYIALEYVDGRDLRAITLAELEHSSVVPPPIACHVAMQVAEALAFAHAAVGHDGRHLEVIHRDLSPHNVMVSFDGAVKVIDFGLAKAAGRATKTRAGILKGKLAYMSPEQASGARLDARSDVFSLGSCMFEMLTGRQLFQRSSEIGTIQAVRGAHVPEFRSLVPLLPFELEAIVRRTLARDPDERYQSAQDLYDALQGFVYNSGLVVVQRQLAEWMEALFAMGESEGPRTGSTQLLRPSQRPSSRHVLPKDGIIQDSSLDEFEYDDLSRESAGPHSSWLLPPARRLSPRSSEYPSGGLLSDRPSDEVEGLPTLRPPVPPPDTLPLSAVALPSDTQPPDLSSPVGAESQSGLLDEPTTTDHMFAPGNPPPEDTIEITVADLKRLVQASEERGLAASTASDEDEIEIEVDEEPLDSRRILEGHIRTAVQSRPSLEQLLEDDATQTSRPGFDESGNADQS